MNNPLFRYVLRRTLQSVPLLLWILVLNFLLIHLAPGDPAIYLASMTEATAEEYQALRVEFGLDKPLPERLGIYLYKVIVERNLGFSNFHNAPVLNVILDRIPATLLLIGFAVLLAYLMGIVFGVLAARHSYSLSDQAATFFSLMGYSMPIFWLGQLLVIFFALKLDWLPSQGMYSLEKDLHGWAFSWDVAKHLILPGFTYATAHLTLVFRLTRGKMQETLAQDFILTAKAKGLDERAILFGHALRNALLPVVTVFGINFGFMMAGSVLTETVFGWPGMGLLIFDSITSRDYPMILGIFIVVSVMVIFANLITDILYAWIDPRVSYS